MYETIQRDNGFFFSKFIQPKLRCTRRNSRKRIIRKTFNQKIIGFYLGSFDPLHRDHNRVAKAALKQKACDFVLIYPSWGGDSYKKKAPIEDRLNMLFSVFQKHPNIIVTKYPPTKLQAIFTINPNDFSQCKIPNPILNKIIGIMGSDLAIDLSKHSNSEYLESKRLEHIQIYMRGLPIPEKYAENSLGSIMALPVKEFAVFIRVPEHGPLLPENYKIEDRQFSIIQFCGLGISSTLIRKLSSDNILNERGKIVSPLVKRIISENKLYVFDPCSEWLFSFIDLTPDN